MRRIDSSRQSTFHPRAPRLIVLGLLCALLACGVFHNRLNVVIIGVDTLRADHLGCYGYHRKTSPNIDQLAADGVLFENCIAPSPWTLPSFATVFTSLYPSQHGARGSHKALGTGFPTLAEILKSQGYLTGAIVNAPYLKRSFKVDRGFDTYDMPPRRGRNASGTTSHALAWIDSLPDKPFLLFVHYFDPHLPYAPPAPYDTLFDPGYHGKIGSRFQPKALPRVRLQDIRKLLTYTDQDWRHIEALYDGEVAFTDRAIGDLLSGLKERGLLDNTLIVFLSDHGEEFLEHGGFEHGHSLYGELLHVPLIFVLKGRIPRGLRLRQQVRLLDILPTILELSGVDCDAHTEGVSLVPLIEGKNRKARGETLLPPHLAFSESILYGPEKKSITAWPWKVIYDTKTHEWMHFDLENDPDEQEPLEKPSPIITALERTLKKTMVNIADTWFVEIQGDSATSFDLEIKSEVVRGSGTFSFLELINEKGEVLPIQSLENADVKPKRITIRELRAQHLLKIALRRSRADAPMSFEVRLNGLPSIDRTYIGKDLTHPTEMPFVLRDPTYKRTKAGEVEDSCSISPIGEPSMRPAAPYVLVYLAKSSFQQHPSIELDEETKRELRSLGYLQ